MLRGRSGACERPRVLCLEWLDPAYVAGHWVPEMVQRAGGVDVLGKRPSRRFAWSGKKSWVAARGHRRDAMRLQPGSRRSGVAQFAFAKRVGRYAGRAKRMRFCGRCFGIFFATGAAPGQRNGRDGLRDSFGACAM